MDLGGGAKEGGSPEIPRRRPDTRQPDVPVGGRGAERVGGQAELRHGEFPLRVELEAVR